MIIFLRDYKRIMPILSGFQVTQCFTISLFQLNVLFTLHCLAPSPARFLQQHLRGDRSFTAEANPPNWGFADMSYLYRPQRFHKASVYASPTKSAPSITLFSCIHNVPLLPAQFGVESSKNKGSSAGPSSLFIVTFQNLFFFLKLFLR